MTIVGGEKTSMFANTLTIVASHKSLRVARARGIFFRYTEEISRWHFIWASCAAVQQQISCESHLSGVEGVLMVQSAFSALVAGFDESEQVRQAIVDHKEARPTRTRFWACRRHPSIRLLRSDAWSAT